MASPADDEGGAFVSGEERVFEVCPFDFGGAEGGFMEGVEGVEVEEEEDGDD